jgi:hypothetical protein
MRMRAPSSRSGRRGGRRQKNKMEMFRWGMGGGYGRPFFHLPVEYRKIFAASFTLSTSYGLAAIALVACKLWMR